jgi:zinc protease
MKIIRRYSIIIFFSMLLAGSISLASEPIKTVLDNGLTVILKEDHAAPVVSMHVYVRAGSMYEGEYLGRGISHYLEHLVSSGTTKRTREEIDRAIEEIGNVSNAYTSKDHASYFITSASSYFDTALDLISDYVLNSTLPEEEVESERGVILNEINMGQDDPQRQLYQLFSGAFFLEHSARHPIIGYRELFEKTTREDIVNYRNRMYVPNNMIFVAAGDFDASEALSRIEEAFKGFERKPMPDLRLPDEPGQVSRRYAEKEMDVQLAYTLMGFRTVDLAHKDLYPLDVLAFIMGTGRSSRLYRTVKDEKQLVYGINSWSYTPVYKHGGYFGIMAALDPANLESAEAAILEEIYKLKTEYVTDEELEKAKALKESEYVFSQQTMEDQAETLGMDELSTGDINFSQRYLEGIKEVTKEEIMRVVKEYFYNDSLTVAVVRPKREAEEAAKPEAPEAESQVQKTVLDNGIKLLVKENRTVPIVAMRVMFLGGVRFENEGNSGISNFMSDMLIKGTESRTAQQIAEEMESIGGSIGTFSGNNSFGASVSVLKRDLDKGLDMLSDVIMNPTFDAEEMDKKRKELLAAIKRSEDDPFSLAAKLFKQTLFKKHPYRFQTMGTAETVGNMKREDLAGFHQKYCIPNNMVLAIFGDVNAAEVVSKVEEAFAEFQSREFSPPKTPVEEPLTEIRQEEAQKDIKQVVIQMGFPGMTVQSEDRYAINVLDAAISGIGYPGGRLHDRLRSSQIVYVVHAYNQAGLDPGLFSIYIGTTPDKVETAMSIIKEEIENVRNELLPDDELERGKKMCISSMQIGLQTNADQAFTMGLDELYGMGYDNISQYESGINAVTKEDVKRVADKYLHLDKYAIAVVKPLEDTEGE